MNNNTKTLNLTADETGRAIVNHMINRLAEQLSPGLGLPFKRVLEMVTAMHQGGNLSHGPAPGRCRPCATADRRRRGKAQLAQFLGQAVSTPAPFEELRSIIEAGGLSAFRARWSKELGGLPRGRGGFVPRFGVSRQPPHVVLDDRRSPALRKSLMWESGAYAIDASNRGSQSRFPVSSAQSGFWRRKNSKKTSVWRGHLPGSELFAKNRARRCYSSLPGQAPMLAGIFAGANASAEGFHFVFP